MTAKIIDQNGHVNYDDQNHDKLMAYYKLNDFFINHAIGHWTSDHIWIPFSDNDTQLFYPDFSNEKWMLKIPYIIEQFGCQELVDKLHRLQTDGTAERLGIKPWLVPDIDKWTKW